MSHDSYERCLFDDLSVGDLFVPEGRLQAAGGIAYRKLSNRMAITVPYAARELFAPGKVVFKRLEPAAVARVESSAPCQLS